MDKGHEKFRFAHFRLVWRSEDQELSPVIAGYVTGAMLIDEKSLDKHWKRTSYHAQKRDGHVMISFAYCDPRDNFSRNMGRRLAVRRLCEKRQLIETSIGLLPNVLWIGEQDFERAFKLIWRPAWVDRLLEQGYKLERLRRNRREGKS